MGRVEDVVLEEVRRRRALVRANGDGDGDGEAGARGAHEDIHSMLEREYGAEESRTS